MISTLEYYTDQFRVTHKDSQPHEWQLNHVNRGHRVGSYDGEDVHLGIGYKKTFHFTRYFES